MCTTHVTHVIIIVCMHVSTWRYCKYYSCSCTVVIDSAYYTIANPDTVVEPKTRQIRIEESYKQW